MRTYSELLQDENWKIKRQLILQRDSRFCQKCKNLEIKNISKKARYIKTISFFQIADFESGSLAIRNDHKIIIQDYIDGIEYESYISLRSTSLHTGDSSKYIVFYSKENNPIDEKKRIYINYLEDISMPENKKHIYVRGLHVHHNYYQDEKFPWEYPDAALTTLCWICHEKLHANKKINWLDKNGNIKGVLLPCNRCHGAGYFPQYSHVQNGICFECGGARFLEFKI